LAIIGYKIPGLTRHQLGWSFGGQIETADTYGTGDGGEHGAELRESEMRDTGCKLHSSCLNCPGNHCELLEYSYGVAKERSGRPRKSSQSIL
jgi:hypothetical protein